MAEELNIIHIDTEKYWRGGQQQAFYLHKGLIKRDIKSLLICNLNSELKNKCENSNLPFAEISMFGEADLIAAYKISKICRKNKFNILHAHSAHSLSIAIMVKYFCPNVKLIGVRRVDFSVNKNYLSKLKYNSKKIDKIICISEFIKTVLLKDGINSDKLVTVRSGVDINKFNKIKPSKDFREKLDVKSDEILLGSIAAFAGHKDIPNLLRAFKIVSEKLDNVKLCLVGDGKLKDEIKQLIDELYLVKKVILPGYQQNVGEYLKSFDIFVLSSKKEGLGTSIIDALAVGLPVVATRAGGIPELIENNTNGVLVDIKNSNLLAGAIIELASDKNKMTELGNNAKQSAKKFSIDETINKNINEYKKLIY